MALSRSLSRFQRHITSTTTFRHQIRRNNVNVSEAEFERLKEKYQYNGLQSKGFQGPHLYYSTTNGFIFRFDVPGIQSSDLRWTATASNFSFTAQESKPHKFGIGHCEPRYYEANMEVDPLVYQPERFTARVSNGVLLVKIPKFRVGMEMGRVCLNIDRFKAQIYADGDITTKQIPFSGLIFAVDILLNILHF